MMKRWTAFVLVLAMAALARAQDDVDKALEVARQHQQARVDLVDKLMPTVCAIFPGPVGRGGGSGVIIDPDGYALTNYHVIRSAKGPEVSVGLSDGRVYKAEVLGIDEGGDIAMIKLRGRDEFPYAPIGDSSRVKIGDWTPAMGNPFTLATDFKPTVTMGIVGGVDRFLAGVKNNALIYTGCIQVDTSINPGNSGGPLFNIKGELIGINGRISLSDRGRVNVGAGYAIPTNQIMFFVEALKRGQSVRHALLGVKEMEEVPEGVRLLEIRRQSAAERGGLREGDILTRVEGRPIESLTNLKNRVGERPAGSMMTFTVLRHGEAREMTVKLGVRPIEADQVDTASLQRGEPDSPVQPSDAAVDPAELVARHVKATGGSEVFRGIGSIVSKGKIEVLVGLTGKRMNILEQVKLPVSSRTVLTPEKGKGKIVFLVTSKDAWQIGGGRQKLLAPEEVMDERRQMRIMEGMYTNGLQDYKMSYLGVSKVAGEEADVVVLTDRESFEDILHFSRQSGLLVKHQWWSAYTGNKMALRYSDYKPVRDGLLMPRREEVFRNDDVKVQEVTWESILANVTLEPELFDPESKANVTKAAKIRPSRLPMNPKPKLKPKPDKDDAPEEPEKDQAPEKAPAE